jgi:ABC-2 type transport system ATP-binding protein
VLLSSHLLMEVEAVADQLLIIGNGRIVADGSREELLAGAGVLVRATDAEELAAALRASDLDFQHVEDGAFVVDAEAEAVGAAALRGAVVLTHLGPSEGAGLEQLFFDLTESPA